MIEKIFSPRKVDRQERRMVITILAITMVTLFLVPLLGLASPNQAPLLYSITAILLVALILAVRSNLTVGKVVVPVLLYGMITYLLFQGGLRDMAAWGAIGVVVVASLLIGEYGTLIFGSLSTVTVLLIGYIEVNKGIAASPYSNLIDLNDVILAGLLVLATGLVQWLVLRRLKRVAETARQNEQAQIEVNQELLSLKEELEKRVSERTAEIQERSAKLEEISNASQRRAEKLQAVALVGRAITSIQNIDTLLPRVTSVISEQFGFYHVGIFLLDEQHRYAVLVAANSMGGQKMLERRHKLKVGEVGIVGFVAEHNAPRIALDTGNDAVYFNNPDLPETHSEMAIPLRIGDDIIGVLDAQSRQPSAFSEEDLRLLGIVGDQVSIAIQNARFFQDAQRSLNEAETAYRQYLRQEWSDVAQHGLLYGYQYSVTGVHSLDTPVSAPEILEAVTTGQTRVVNGERPKVVIPIKIRGETIGVLNVESTSDTDPGQDGVEIAEAVASRLAVAIENARLFDETTRRAERERKVSEITSRIRSTNDPNEMMQIALTEIKQALKVKTARILPYLSNDNEEEEKGFSGLGEVEE